jgi:tetratricopeptide (TPR) repeat protein
MKYPHAHPSVKGSSATILGRAVMFTLLLSGGVAFAAGGGSSSGGTSGSSSSSGGDAASGKAKSKGQPDLTTCSKGMVWDGKNQKCVAKQSGVLPDADLTEYAYALAKADRYPEAIEILDMLADPNTPRALNYRGYATRKMGRTDEGISYYMKSVALDPNYAQVREYLGEAYVIQGKFDLANDQLSTIQKLCGGTDCEEYEELSDAIHQAQGS